MNPLQCALISKTGYDFGFEYVAAESESGITLASARHPAAIEVAMDGTDYVARLVKGNALLPAELARHFAGRQGCFHCDSIDRLARLLRRAAELAHSLPNHAQHDFDVALAGELEKLPEAMKGTEVERLVRQRVGQQTFRGAMLDYWGGACALTGIAIPEVLRASHAKPWADCASDAERLDVFNGFLLNANLDALFDRFLISFSAAGELLIAPSIAASDREHLGLNQPMRLRWLAPEHERYLCYHRHRFGANA
ncbi:MAG: HNH endonuclease [Methylococcaceae bacterium]|nr:HNH endonuclease [Methylococcaceae bacterium]